MLGLVAAGTLGYLPVNLRDSALALDGVCSVSLLCALTVSVFWHCSLLDGVPLLCALTVSVPSVCSVLCGVCALTVVSCLTGSALCSDGPCSVPSVTIRASLSQRVVSYTETARACRQVSGLVATPAQWTPCSRQNGAGASSAKRAPSSPTKQLGDHSWLINSLGDVSAARAAPNDGADAAAGQRLPRPRPSSARRRRPAGVAGGRGQRSASRGRGGRQRAAAARRSAPLRLLEVESHSGPRTAARPPRCRGALTVTLEADDEPGSELSH
ncbi:hypothetical protein FJT64_018747 [Amphibalanus amphitrite]|uniref:Uncharacterized protein n=1 Tax=Amphibalanus amphitrite TaxID=1232801 RepID=A0A6A4X2F9_AMPAM|nr:hypothetical protein FJT64_018747 [Amphibalanus amphitrite]